MWCCFSKCVEIAVDQDKPPKKIFLGLQVLSSISQNLYLILQIL